MSAGRSARRALATLAALILIPGAVRAQSAPRPDSAQAAYLRGQEILKRGEAKIPSPWGILNFVTVWEDLLGVIGKDHLSRARDAFDRAIAYDSTHAGAASALAALAVASGDGDALRDAAAALRTATSAAGAPAEAWLWRARVAGALGDSARSDYIVAYAKAGGDAAMARLLEARAAFDAGRDSVGTTHYLAGLDGLTSLAADAYYQDLSAIARDPERSGWKSATAAQRGEWIRRFWARRAAESGVGVGERIAEHYRRLKVALERYRRTSHRESSISDADAIRLDYHVDGLDDRGLVYLLQGQPDTIIRTVAGALPNESWYYRRPGGDMMLHFVSPNRAAEFVLVADPLRALGPLNQDTCLEEQCVDRVLAILEDRAVLDPRYGVLAARYRTAVMANKPGNTRGADAARELRLQEAALATDAAKVALNALSRDRFTPDLGSPLPFYYDTYAFRGDGGRTDLVVGFAVPGDGLKAQTADQGVLYGLNMDVVVTDTSAGRSFRADSQRVFRAPRRLADKENLRAILELELPPGTGYEHRVVVKSALGGSGTAYGGPLEIPAFSGDSAMMSDVVLAEGAGKGWHRGKVELGLVPPRQFPRASVVSLFYELYNLRAGAQFTTHIRVMPVGGGGIGGFLKKLVGKGGAPISLGFTEEARPDSAGAVQVLRRVDLRGLKEGVYRLEVETETGGRVLRREREFAVK